MSSKIIVFDLDDTLISERDYLISAYTEIARSLDANNVKDLLSLMIKLYDNGDNVFQFLARKYSVSIGELLSAYRNHYPCLNLKEGALELLEYCKQKSFTLGLITDGRSITQRNKLSATNLDFYFDEILISEEFGTDKHNQSNFKYFTSRYGEGEYFYIGDNTIKDFYHPNKIGWKTICLLDSGQNIHKQHFNLESDYLPQYKIKYLVEAIDIINL